MQEYYFTLLNLPSDILDYRPILNQAFPDFLFAVIELVVDPLSKLSTGLSLPRIGFPGISNPPARPAQAK